MSVPSGAPAPKRRRRKSRVDRPTQWLWWCLILTWIPTLLGYAESVGWPVDLLVHFRVQYLVVAAVLAIGFLLVGRRGGVALSLIAVALNGVAIAPLYYSGLAQSDESPLHRALLLNVQTSNTATDEVGALIDSVDADVVVLLEVNDRWLHDLAPHLRQYSGALARPRGDDFGLAVYTRPRIAESHLQRLGDAGVPAFVARVSLDSTELTVVAAHLLPPGSRTMDGRNAEEFDDLADVLSKLEPTSHHVLLLGDLNATPWSARFHALIDYSRMFDGRRGHGLNATWPTYAPPLLVPIDHCVTSRSVRIDAMSTGPRVGSDHYPLIVDFRLR